MGCCCCFRPPRAEPTVARGALASPLPFILAPFALMLLAPTGLGAFVIVAFGCGATLLLLVVVFGVGLVTGLDCWCCCC